ncbi:MAG: hypothetical protein LKI80_11385 [Sporolactobacillus sp.]|jgi:hypothetical protein|nr:hypothetical protein [Sporolactobacillus sp.]
MRLIIDDTTKNLSRPTVQQVLNEVQHSLPSGRFYSHLVADGEAVYENEEKYLQDHLVNIHELKIMTQTVHEMVAGSLKLATGYLNRAVPQLPELADRFYQNPGPDDWKTFSDLLGGIEWLDETLTLIARVRTGSRRDVLQRSLNAIRQQVKNMDEALKASDSTLTADILQYEIQPLFIDLRNQIKQDAAESEAASS